MTDDPNFQARLEAVCAMAEASLEGAFGEGRAAWMQRLEAGHAGMVELLDALLGEGQAEAGLRLAFLLQELWFEPAHTAEGLAWLERFLAHLEARTSQRAAGLDLAGALALNLGEYAKARRLKLEALAIYREGSSRVEAASTLFHLGHQSGLVHGNYAEARAYYQEGLDLLREAGHSEGIAHGLANLGTAAAGLGDYAQAAPLLTESTQSYRQRGSRYNLGLALRRAAGVAAGLGLAEAAFRLAGASDRQRAAIGVSEPEVYRMAYERLLDPARQQLNADRQARLRAEGAALSLDEALDLALSAIARRS